MPESGKVTVTEGAPLSPHCAYTNSTFKSVTAGGEPLKKFLTRALRVGSLVHFETEHFNFAWLTVSAKSLVFLVSPDIPNSFSFIATSLRPELLRVVAETYLRTGSWETAKTHVLESNALQARSPSSAIRMERELRQRLTRMTPVEIDLAANGITEERTAVAWLAALKSSRYIYAFASETLRGKLSALDPVLRASDYEAFFENQSAIHPEICGLTAATRTKVRTMVLTMVREAGVGEKAGRELRIHRPLLPPAVRAAILDDSPQWLAGFLVSDSEIPVK